MIKSFNIHALQDLLAKKDPCIGYYSKHYRTPAIQIFEEFWIAGKRGHAGDFICFDYMNMPYIVEQNAMINMYDYCQER